MNIDKFLNQIKKRAIGKDDFRIEQEIDEDLVQVKINQIGLSSLGLEGILVLKTDDGREFPISAFSGEVARHISNFYHNQKDVVPSIYNLLEQLAEESELFLVKVKIFDNGNSLRANLYFSGKKNLVLRNFRASDAIALATFYGVPILIKKVLLKETKQIS